MKIEPISNGNLRIWLAEKEIEEWGLNDTSRHGVRRLVRRVLTEAGRRTVTRVAAEMIPVEGGCVLLVSPLTHIRHLPAVYAVEGEDVLLDICSRWHRLARETAQVYAVGEEYRIVVYDDDMEYLLQEYARPVGRGEGAAAHTEEYGELLTVLAPALPETGDPPP